MTIGDLGFYTISNRCHDAAGRPAAAAAAALKTKALCIIFKRSGSAHFACWPLLTVNLRRERPLKKGCLSA
jgi:hypothetical protein